MAEYLIQGETLESMADKIRILNGVEGALTTAQMDGNLGEVNVEVDEQAELIEQIASALEGKAGGSASYDTCAVTIENATKLASLDYISTRDEIILPIHYSSSFPSSCEVVKNTIMVVEPSTSYRISGISGQIENVDNRNRIFKVTGDATISLRLLCYIENTEITLADGNCKKVQDIAYNDQLLVWDFDNGCYASSYPLWIKEEEIALSYYHCIFENGTTLGLVGSNGNCHAVFCLDDNCFEYANNCVGKMIMTENGATKLLSCEQKHEAVKFYNIITNHHINCYANGVLTSSKLNNIYPIEKMKFVMEDRPIIPIEKFGDIQEEFYHGLRLGENKIEDLEYIQIKLSKMLTKGGT